MDFWLEETASEQDLFLRFDSNYFKPQNDLLSCSMCRDCLLIANPEVFGLIIHLISRATLEHNSQEECKICLNNLIQVVQAVPQNPTVLATSHFVHNTFEELAPILVGNHNQNAPNAIVRDTTLEEYPILNQMLDLLILVLKQHINLPELNRLIAIIRNSEGTHYVSSFKYFYESFCCFFFGS